MWKIRESETNITILVYEIISKLVYISVENIISIESKEFVINDEYVCLLPNVIEIH